MEPSLLAGAICATLLPSALTDASLDNLFPLTVSVVAALTTTPNPYQLHYMFSCTISLVWSLSVVSSIVVV